MPARLAHLVTSLALSASLGPWLTPLPAARAAPSAGHTFIVNSLGDAPDASPGDGHCETVISNTVCTLRAAVQEANALPDTDTIQLQPHTTYQLTRGGVDDTALNGDLDLLYPVNVLGAGAGSSIVDAGSLGIPDRVFQIFASATISGVTVQHGNGSEAGGGIQNSGLLILVNSAVLSNTLGGGLPRGAGVQNNGTLTVSHSLIAGNAMSALSSSADMRGGGLANEGNLWVLDSTIFDNHVDGDGSNLALGGGLYTHYAATVINSTLRGNTAQEGGGASNVVYDLTVINSTLDGNVTRARGAGLANLGGTVNLFNTTLSANLGNQAVFSPTAGGGLANGSGGSVTLNNSVLAYNLLAQPGHSTVNDDCSGPLTGTGGNMLMAYNPAYCQLTGAFTQADPRLGPLQDNGGPTLTRALLPGSPAIDVEDASHCLDNLGAPLATDQRGRPRVANGAGATRCDLGAYEVQRIVFLALARR
jgi:CSLREA domain-containing protein